MRILIIGATGFIGRHVCARLASDGHAITAAVRTPAAALRRFPDIHAVRVELNRMGTIGDWLPLLAGVDAVVNCAGILQSGRGQSAVAIHADAPRALFDACVAARVRRVIQLSAVSADAGAGTEYAATKQAADDHLRSLDLDWVVLRPSLVYGQGSFGGTSIIRGLAGLPFVTPLIGDGGQRFQPIHADDVAETVARCLERPALARRTLEPVGPETLSMREILRLTRRWLDLPPAHEVFVSVGMVRVLARIGDVIGGGPLRSTSLDQMAYGNVADPSAFEQTIGFRPRRMADAMVASPSHVQDRWHARLYFLAPLLTIVLSLLWLLSGLSGLWQFQQSSRIAAALGVPASLVSLSVVASCLSDIAIALALVAGFRPRLLGQVQLVVIGCYTLGFGVLMPALWIDPLGRLVKNLPILAAVAGWMALQDDK
jgi:uncharacterized protein YbjT (DUF2867 family)